MTKSEKKAQKAYKQAQWKRHMEHVAEKCGVQVSFYEDKEYQEPFEDDGTLHIPGRHGLRACFAVGSDEPGEQNANTLKVLNALMLKMTERTTTG